MSRSLSLHTLMVAIFLAVLLACNSGSKGLAPTSAADFSVGSYALTLQVDPSTTNPSGTTGTTTITVTRKAGFTSSLNLSLGSLPAGVKANFDQATITGDAADLSIEAGYPDPSDPTFVKQIIPKVGSYAISIIANSGGEQVTGVLNLTISSSLQNFAVDLFTDASGSSLDSVTSFNLHPGTAITHAISAYVSAGSYPNQPVTLSVEGLATGLHAGFDSTTVNLNDMHTLTLQADPGIAPGTYSFRVKALHQNGQARYLSLVVTCSDAPFWIQPETSPSLVQGGAITFPVQLGRNDVFFQYTGGTDPAYLYSTDLSAVSLPTGFSVTFGDPNPRAVGTVALSINAATTVTPGTYHLTLRAARNGNISDLDLPVVITASAGSPAIWVQRVEWGQTALESDLPLIPGKPALLRAHLLADRSGVSSPVMTAKVEDGGGNLIDTLSLSCPAMVPTTTNEGDLATTATTEVPGVDIQPGMKVLIQGGGSTLQTLTPAVESTGYAFSLTVVPIVHMGVMPVLPVDAEIQSQILAYWPIQGLHLTHRAPYTTATVIPIPNATLTLDHSTQGWIELLSEISSLRMIDNTSDSYYGFFNLGLPSSFQGNTTVGIHFQGQGAGIGIDSTTGSRFAGLLPEVETMVHELGHGFNVNHAPLGGAGSPMMNFPYAGGHIGSWGYDPATTTLYDPTLHYDIMGYGTGAKWISDWDYLAAMGFIRNLTLGGTPIPLPVITSTNSNTSSDQLLVSGWQGPDGKIHLAPLVQTVCKSMVPKAGELELRLASRSSTQRVPFQAQQVADLPQGYRNFTFTVPAGEELTNLEIRSGTESLLRRQVALSVTKRADALAQAIQTGSLVVDEQNQMLHLRWNANEHPFVSVVHEGATRTTMALHLSGGAADLSLEGLPQGGRFVLHFSDGLNTLKQRVERD